MSLLNVENLEVSYGLIKAIKGISFHVEEGEIVALIGSNGAGKTTTMHAVSKLMEPDTGKIEFAGKDVTRYPAHKIVALGMSQVPEGRRIFQQLKVRDNLTMGAFTRRNKSEFARTLEEMYALFPILKEREHQIAGTLSGGEQQMLAVARAMMAHPKLLLLDEPSMGLSPLYVSQIFSMVGKINESGVTVLLVEQNAKQALSIAHRAYVLETGNISLEGTGKELLNNERVKRAYLGEEN
ncbi:MAG: ABC transporter ATP-binding protein [Firmicutes bacterium]|jgi:high affinity branched-chain amino acid ABC transporter, ATP-binding protein|nr:ABC transporter ATP-binding protein [Clostridia bacterium]MBS5022681.1 ABC transporter ATP-binding protein [Bacillota bacterium]